MKSKEFLQSGMKLFVRINSEEGLTYKKKMPYFVYITTNPARSSVYVGMTNNIQRRMKEHYENRGEVESFADRYYCFKLVYYEYFNTAWEAIEREKEIKKWRREKKDALIESVNPSWYFLNYTDDFRVGRVR